MRTYLFTLLMSSLCLSLSGQTDLPYAIDYLDLNQQGREVGWVERVLPGADADVVVMWEQPQSRHRFFRFDGETFTPFFLARLDNFDYSIQARLGDFIIINDRSGVTNRLVTQLNIRDGETRILFTASSGWRGGAVAGAGYVYLDDGRRVWGTDGTENGTFMIAEQVSDFAPYTWNDHAVVATDQGVFISDGTPGGTTLLHPSPVEQVADTTISDGQFYLSLGNALFVTDGTTDGSSYLIEETNGQFLTDLTRTSAGVVFLAFSPETGREAWTTDGTLAGTRLIVDLFPGEESGVGSSAGVSTLADRLFFRGSPDGTLDRVYEVLPTGLVERLQISDPGATNWRLTLLAQTGDDHLFFRTTHLTDEEVLWRLDPAGGISAIDTFSRFALPPGQVISSEHGFFFQSADAPLHIGYANTATTGTQLIDSVGPYNGRWRVAGDDLYYSFQSFDPEQPLVSFMRQVDGLTGTVSEVSVYTPRDNKASPFLPRDGRMYCVGLDSFSAEGLFRFEGETANLLQDIFPYTDNAQLEVIGRAGEHLYLNNGEEIYVVGPEADTARYLGPYTRSNSDPIPLGETLFFLLEDDLGALVRPGGIDFINFPVEYRPRRSGYIIYQEDLFFLVNNSNNRRTEYYLVRLDLDDLTNFTEVFAYQSEEALPDWNLIAGQIAVADNRLFFPYPSPANGWELGQSDGTVAGTSLFEDILFGTASSAPQRIYGEGPRLAVQISTPIGGNNLYLRRLDQGQRIWASTDFSADRLDGLTSLRGYSFLRLRLSTSGNDGLLVINDQTSAIRSLEFRLNSPLWPLSGGRMGWWQGLERFYITAGPAASDELIEGITDADDDASVVRDDILFYVANNFGQRSLHALELNEQTTYDFPAITPDFDTRFYPTSSRVFFPATSLIPNYELHFFGRTDLRECTGTVFLDEDEDGTQDEDEVGLPGQIVLANGTDRTLARTATDGQFQLRLQPDQSYTVTVREQTCFGVDIPISYSIGPDDACPEPLVFGLQEQAGEPDYRLNLTLSPNRCGFVVPGWLMVENAGCEELLTEVRLTLPEGVSLVSSDIPPSQAGGTILYWDNVNLGPGERWNVALALQMPDETLVGQALDYRLAASGIYSFDLQYDEELPLTRTLRCAIDPNDKLVAPSRAEPSNSNYTQIDETLLYTIRFQNTGNDTAINVRLEDQLDPLLDWDSFTPLDASHPYWVNLDEVGNLTVYFDKIYLPDSIVNEPASHGFFAFTIDLLPEALENSVANTAGIYFDFNAPIITNTVSNAVVEFLDRDEDSYFFWEDCEDDNPDVNPGMEEIAGNGIDDDCQDGDAPLSTQARLAGQLTVMPNPTTELLSLNYSEPTLLEVTLFDSYGRLVGAYPLRGDRQLNLRHLPAGVYLLRVVEPTSGRFLTRRVVKQ